MQGMTPRRSISSQAEKGAKVMGRGRTDIGEEARDGGETGYCAGYFEIGKCA